ncbi:MAG: penicillin-binding protein 1A [Halothiobacillaceae bacterium]
MSFLTFVFKFVFYLVVFMVLLALSAWGVARYVYSEELPDVNSLREMQYQVPMRIYDRDGGLMAEFGEKRRIPVTIEQVPPLVKNAFLAAEDDRFYQHPGVDWQGLFRAAWELLRTGHKGQGGSTITMQVARNFFLNSEKTYSRKFNEILLAIKIERELTKDQILELYLNKIYLGNRAYGVAAAASIYYNKTLGELSPAEAAMLAGLPKAPSKYNPIINPTRAKIRRDYVLGRMFDLGQLPQDKLELALAEPVSTTLYMNATVELNAPFVAEMARARMVQEYGDAAYEMGLRVYTSIDARLQIAAAHSLQKALLDYERRYLWRGAEAHGEMNAGDVAAAASLAQAQQAVEGLLAAVVLEASPQKVKLVDAAGVMFELDAASLRWMKASLGKNKDKAVSALRPGDVVRVRSSTKDGVATLAQTPDISGAFVAFEPQTGAMLALSGGFDFALSKFNRAFQAQRQPGSSFKPFLYSAALENGFTLASVISDAPLVFSGQGGNNDDWKPENYGGSSYGPTRLHEALVRSQNLVSVRIIDAITPQVALNHAKLFGLPTKQWNPTLSLALGSYALTPYELAAGYMVFANGGYRVAPYFIQRVENVNGVVLFEQPAPKFCETCAPDAVDVAPRVVAAENIWLTNLMLRDVAHRGTGAAAGKALKRPDVAGKTGTTNDQRDAWFCGFGPGVVATAWVGYDDYHSMGRKETGGSAALPMWIDFMQVALKDVPVQENKPPKGIVTASIDAASGMVVPDGTPGSIKEFFDGRRPLYTTAVMKDLLPPADLSESLGDAQVTEELF